jgi:hypothetical protein
VRYQTAPRSDRSFLGFFNFCVKSKTENNGKKEDKSGTRVAPLPWGTYFVLLDVVIKWVGANLAHWRLYFRMKTLMDLALRTTLPQNNCVY